MSSTVKPPTEVRPRRNMAPGRKKSANPFTRLIGWIWKYEVWLEGITSLGMMELWEKILILSVFLTLSSLIWWSIYFYLPGHIRSVVARASYYIFGTPSSAPREALHPSFEQVIQSAKASTESLKSHLEL